MASWRLDLRALALALVVRRQIGLAQP